MENIKGRDCSTAYGENPGAELPTKDIIRGVRKEASADKKAKNKINNSEAVLRVVDVKRNDEQDMPDEFKTLANMFGSLSDDNQSALFTIVENFIKLSPNQQTALCVLIKNFANFPEDKQSEISSFVKYLERTSKTEPSDPADHTQPDVTKSKLGIQQRPKGERTERTNLSFPPLLKDALTRAAKKQNKSVSLYVSDVLSKQPEVTQELSI
ncbi:MAG: hypothetical protein NMNS01_11960 [Nitrosomonas sp.]|nr:MAG: hypothetical protein NMNS01_11960 [Nitrosomonas sp.]